MEKFNEQAGELIFLKHLTQLHIHYHALKSI